MSENKGKLTIVQLYPEEMNIYGDHGNVLTLQKRAQWHGYEAEVLYHMPRKPFPAEADIIVGGGGQDSGQLKVQEDLQTNSETLHNLADEGLPMLMVCGLYQLFGRFFKTANGDIIKGIGIFKAETHASDKRMIGNVVAETKFGTIVGYENHSGQTYLDDPASAFATIKKGAGNNGQDKTEGEIYKNVFGTYLHGSLLPRNPVIADELIKAAAIRKFGEFEPGMIDDHFARRALSAAESRPR